jgi:UDP-N-acetylmuramoylalanine--D-glutamate ligase
VGNTDKKGIVDALARGAVLTSEMESFISLSPAVTFAITGSDGKTTTTTLTGKFLESAGRTFVGGNIGTPLLDKTDSMEKKDFAVLELSSFQLMTLHDAPEYVALTNISPNHLDWHTDEEEYARAKYNIVGNRTKRVVLNADSKKTYDFGLSLLAEGGREVIFFSSSKTPKDIPEGAKLTYLDGGVISFYDGQSTTPILDSAKILLPGKHNAENYMTAISLTLGVADPSVYLEAAESFGGVEHRLELVRRLDGVDYYNSSIDSSPTRTAAALSALCGRDIVAICGGYDKNLSYEPLARSLCSSVRAAVLTGATAPKIMKALEDFEGYDPERLTVVLEESFEGAVKRASLLAREGGCVLLSPASASFDRFKNFAERGRYFKKLVSELN